MADLISLSRATQNSTLAGLATGSNAALLASLVSSASDVVRQICKREFTQETVTEYYDGGFYNESPLLLNRFPVVAITRVASDPEQALLVQNTNSTLNQRATVATTSTGLALTRMASGVGSSNTLGFSAYVTISALATAINALGNGWLATPQAGYSLWPSVDLKPLQGALNAMGGGATLELYTEDIQWVGFDSASGGYGWRLDSGTGALYGVFPRGNQNIRIDYTAGFAEVPAAVQEATVSICQSLYRNAQANSALKSASLGDASITLAIKAMPATAKMLLDPYMDHSRVIGR